MKIKSITLVVLLATTYACKKPTIPASIENEAEQITTLKLIFTAKNMANADSNFSFSYSDKDGLGGNAPIKDNILLFANKDYTVNAEVLDESKNPIEDITVEIKKEANDHQLFYVSSFSNLNVSTLDVDLNNNPLGLQTKWTTLNKALGTVKIVLKHQPDIKPASPGNINVGDTDVEVIFNVEIK